MAPKRVLFVDDSLVTKRVVRKLLAQGHQAEVCSSFEVSQDLGSYDLMVIDPAMPAVRQDLPAVAVHDDALEFYEHASSRVPHRVVFSAFSRPRLGAIMDGVDGDLLSQDIFSKREPEALLEYISALADSSPPARSE